MNVYCLHSARESKEGNDCYVYTCKLCGAKWYSIEGDPKVIIGYTDDSEKVTGARSV